jgi:hypothetical protein
MILTCSGRFDARVEGYIDPVQHLPASYRTRGPGPISRCPPARGVYERPSRDIKAMVAVQLRCIEALKIY